MFLYLTPNCCLNTKTDLGDGIFNGDFSKLLKVDINSSSSLNSHISQVSRSSSGNSQRSRCNSSDSSNTEKYPHLSLDFMTYTTEARVLLKNFKSASKSWSAVYDGMDVITERDHIRLSSKVSKSGTIMSYYYPGNHSFLDRSVSFTNENLGQEKLEDSILSESTDFDISPGAARVALPKYDTECVGPFLNALFDRLEDMLDNDVYVNLKLTSLIKSLVHYPQPLLRSYFLSANLVIRPGVRSFIKVRM